MTDPDMTPVILVDAAHDMIAHERHDGLCWYHDALTGHLPGSNPECPVCRLAAAVELYRD